VREKVASDDEILATNALTNDGDVDIHSIDAVNLLLGRESFSEVIEVAEKFC